MALYYDLPVFKDVYKLVLKIFDYTKDFPREYKHTLGQDMKRDSLQLVRSIYRANKAKEKRAYLETFLDDFELLKFEIRLCVDMKILSIKKQAELSQLMEAIGKQIVGWRNANPQKHQNSVANANYWSSTENNATNAFNFTYVRHLIMINVLLLIVLIYKRNKKV